MTQIRGKTPEEYAGALQHVEEIPHRYRLETYGPQYQDENVWEQYVQDIALEEHDSERMRRTWRLAGESWLTYMEGCERHHALARPSDTNRWCENLLDDKARRTAYDYYFLRVYEFYNHLKFSSQHPHLYNPLLLAAVRYDAARHIWMHRVDERQRRHNNE